MFSNFAPPPLGPEGIPVGVLAYSDSPQPGSSNNHIRVFRHAATKWCGALILLVGCFIGGSAIAAAATTEPQVSLSASNLSFGDVAVGSSSKQSFTITSTGSGPVTVDSVTPSGTVFTVSGASFPLTLNTPGQVVKLTVQFKPTTAGVDSGRLTIISNSTYFPNTSVGISGTGTGGSTAPQVTLSASSLSFGDVAVGSSSTQSFTITSTGSGAATVDSVTPSGTGFTVSGASFPLTLSTPGQAVKLTVQFKPTTAGVDSGRLTIISNSTHYPDTSVGINGTGTSAEQHQVDLNWSAPSSSPVPVSGYNILRATGGGKFQVMNSSVYEPTTYVDSTVQSATTYSYEVESVDSSGVTSSPSNEVTVTVP